MVLAGGMTTPVVWFWRAKDVAAFMLLPGRVSMERSPVSEWSRLSKVLFIFVETFAFLFQPTRACLEATRYEMELNPSGLAIYLPGI